MHRSVLLSILRKLHKFLTILTTAMLNFERLAERSKKRMQGAMHSENGPYDVLSAAGSVFRVRCVVSGDKRQCRVWLTTGKSSDSLILTAVLLKKERNS